MNKIGIELKFLIYWLFGICLLFLFDSNISYSQTKTYRVFFKDKGPGTFSVNSDLYNQTLKTLAPRAIKRRLKVRTTDKLITIEDSPVYLKYIQQIEYIGGKYRYSLNWRNYAVFNLDTTLINDIKQLEFVDKIQETTKKISTLSIDENHSKNNTFSTSEILVRDFFNCSAFDYGMSYLQADMLGITKLHSCGLTGDSVLLGYLDSGFRWRLHNALKDANVVAEYDFVQLDSITSNQDGDDIRQDNHGTETLSLSAGYLNGKLIGMAPTACYILAKTEDLKSETRLEEDNYAAALEWMERSGADISTSSVGYFKLDSTDISYIYDDLDGKTTITARVINDAVSRGMVCITAAGNTGSNPKTLNTPADADSVISVGAVKTDAVTPASFTSRGPSSDNVIKPDIAAMGVSNTIVSPTEPDKVTTGNGTSFATPLIAGGTALLLSAHPELKPWEVRNLIYKTGRNANQKNNNIGYGVPDFFEVVKNAGLTIASLITYPSKNYQRVVTYILSDNMTENPVLEVVSGNQVIPISFEMYPTSHQYQYAADIPFDIFTTNLVKVQIKAKTIYENRCYPNDCLSYITISQNDTRIPCGIDENDLPIIAADNNAFLFPSVLESGNNIIQLNVNLTQESDISFHIYSSDGRLYDNGEIPTRTRGIVNYPLHIGNLASGAYFVMLKYQGSFQTLSFMIIR